ncbi:MAG: Mut7-C RNAse domain-containing protein [Wenzhouxiangella sp.]|nr:Mut7-C RNAse domain-containing protein [Wenzhouxiangella sp.]
MSGRARSCTFRFYEELNDFLAPKLRRRTFEHGFDGTPSVKDRIESLGVPHTEVDLVLVDGESVDFAHRLCGGERVTVYPVFERLDIAPVTRLRPEPLRDPRFVIDVHLARLAAYLRLLGFDCLHERQMEDERIIRVSLADHRIILTRDVGLLKDGRVTHGAFVHATRPLGQLAEIVERFQLEALYRPWTRCMLCNALLEAVAVSDLDDEALPPDVRSRFDRLHRCPDCGRVYWPGSHTERLRRRLAGAGIDLPPAAA